jgi:CheY-like chemotaxis protein
MSSELNSLLDRRPPLRVLLAEDNVANERLALALLKESGAVVTVAQTGRDALEAWAISRFDVVLMDIHLPELDGFDATRIIRAREDADEHVPIIALTARATTGDRERCLAAGMDDFVAKPLHPATLMEIIERLVGDSRVGAFATEAFSN